MHFILPQEFQEKFAPHFRDATAELVGYVAETVNPHESAEHNSTQKSKANFNIILPKSRKR